MDRVQAATNSDNAAAFAKAVDARMADGSLDAKARRRAACAIAVCGLHSREMCIELLSVISTRDADTRIQEASLAAAQSITEGTATVKSLEKLFK